MWLSSSNRKYPPFPLLSYFSVVVCLRCFCTSYSVICCIYVPGKQGICFHYYCAVYDECKYSDTFWPADHTRLFVQYTISLSSLCKLIWRHGTYKMPVRYILSSVWVRLSIFSPLSIIQHVGLCVFSLPIPLVMLERIYTICLIIIIISEVRSITHCLGLGDETMVCAVCLYIFLPGLLPPALFPSGYLPTMTYPPDRFYRITTFSWARKVWYFSQAEASPSYYICSFQVNSIFEQFTYGFRFPRNVSRVLNYLYLKYILINDDYLYFRSLKYVVRKLNCGYESTHWTQDQNDHI